MEHRDTDNVVPNDWESVFVIAGVRYIVLNSPRPQKTNLYRVSLNLKKNIDFTNASEKMNFSQLCVLFCLRIQHFPANICEYFASD